MWSSLDRYRDHLLLVLRLGVGLGFVWFHGWPKVSGGPELWANIGGAMENFGIGFAPAFWGLLAALGECLGGLLIALGLFFRPAALWLCAVMFTATVNHFVTGQGTPAHAFKNLFFFIGLLGVGPGRFSLDAKLFGRGDGASAGVPAGPGAGGPGMA